MRLATLYRVSTLLALLHLLGLATERKRKSLNPHLFDSSLIISFSLLLLLSPLSSRFFVRIISTGNDSVQIYLGSMSSSTTTGVTVIWDFQYAWIPEGYDLRTLKTSIETALKRCNPDFFIEGKLRAVGHASGDKHQAITMLPDDIKFSPVRPDNIRTPDPEDQTALELVMKLTMKVLAKATNILVISGNYDLMGAINGWRQRNIFMMLALPESSSSSPSIYHCANLTWLWASEDPESAAATMVNGGGPILPAPV